MDGAGAGPNARAEGRTTSTCLSRRSQRIAILFCAGLVVVSPAPASQACVPPHDAYPFCNTSLTIPQRVADLLSRFDNQTKSSMMKTAWEGASALGVPPWNFYTEGLHGVIFVGCVPRADGSSACASSFPAGGCLGASFNRSLLRAVGSAIADEVRAFSNANVSWTSGKTVQPAAWLPNLNIGRDPRWGRQVETISEDPVVIGILGGAMIDGAQYGLEGASATAFMKMIVVAKHGTAYQVETDRFNSDDSIAPEVIVDTFLPAWEIVSSCAVPGIGCVSGFMCSYNAINSLPMCAASWFRQHLVASGLGSTRFGASYVQSDCRAIDSLRRGPLANFTPTEAVGFVLNSSSCDVDCPGHDMPALAWPAVRAGFAPASAIDAIATRLLTLQFLTGRFDPPGAQPFTRIGLDAVDSPAARALAHDAALQGIVLLRNDNDLLPFTPGKFSIACIGPYCNATADFLGNYFVTRCPRPNSSEPHDVYTCIPTLADSLRAGNAGSTVTFSWGCDTNDATKQDISAAVAAAAAADIVVLALGTNAQCPPSVGCTAAEGHDRVDTSLPGAQAALALAVLAVGKPTALVFVSGSSLGFDALLSPRASSLGVVWAGHVGEAGGAPIADALFGVANRFGKLPHTLYPLNYTRSFAISDFAMAPNATTSFPGRTYKYYSGPVLFPAFHGLSYTSFSVLGSCNMTRVSSGLGCFVNVTNTGARQGDEVVTVFAVPPSGPLLRQLVDFARVTLAPGESVSLPFNVSMSALAQADASGARVVQAGNHALSFCRGAYDESCSRVRLLAHNATLVRGPIN
jgi:beta-D-xylosidase 4